MEIKLIATPAQVWLEMAYTADALGACARLHDSFRATLGDAELPIENPGERGKREGLDCVAPSLELLDPPVADVIVLGDDSLEVTIPMQGRLEPRSLQRVPEAPWIFLLGENVTAQYTPADKLGEDGTFIYEIRIAGGSTRRDVITYTAEAGKFTFELPLSRGVGVLEMGGASSMRPWTCTNARCQLLESTVLKQPFEIR